MFFGVLVVFVSMIIGAQLDPVQARLQQIAARPRTLEELELQRPLSERMLKPIIAGFSGLVGRFYNRRIEKCCRFNGIFMREVGA